MELYKYKMLQIPPDVIVQRGNYIGDEAAKYLQNITNEQAKSGWEFFRVDTFTVRVKPGCLGALFGQRQTVFDSYVVTFRRITENTNASTEASIENVYSETIAASKGKVTARKTIIRAFPGAARGSRGELELGANVSIYGRNIDSRWVAIEEQGHHWVFAGDLEIEDNLQSLPIISDLK